MLLCTFRFRAVYKYIGNAELHINLELLSALKTSYIFCEMFLLPENITALTQQMPHFMLLSQVHDPSFPCGQ